jgi:hypothetical protein
MRQGQSIFSMEPVTVIYVHLIFAKIIYAYDMNVFLPYLSNFVKNIIL